MAEQKRFAGLATRTQLRAANNLGIILKRTPGTSSLRRQDLELFDAYYEKRQYDGLPEWDENKAADDSFIPVRKRKPRLNLNLSKTLASRLAAKLVGQRTFPELKIEDDPETEDLIRTIKQVSRLRGIIVEPMRRGLISGSVFVRFALINGQFFVQHFLSKHAFPEFDAAQNLMSVRIQFVFEDKEDLDPKTQMPKKKWFRLDLDRFKDTSYDNPEFEEGTDPQFTVTEVVEHDLGFVQGEWYKTADVVNSPDGPSLIEDVLDFFDELNYNFSQSSTAIEYNQDPQLALSGMDEEETEQLIRSSFKAWNFGKEGKGEFLETTLSGVEKAGDFRGVVRQNIQDIVRVLMLDPEKIVGSAQSAKAMEILHGPLVELVEELRPMVEKFLVSLCLKMTLTVLIQSQRGAPTPVIVPPGFRPQSLNLTVSWPEIFPMTMEDLQKKVGVAASASTASLISRETLTKWLAKDFGIEDPEEEIKKIAAQPIINPFGGF